MWIQQVEDKFVAIAYNPEKNVSMVMSKPRTSYDETLQWVRGWCGTFCPLPAWIMMKTNQNSSWIDELIKWENTHPEYKPFKEDKDSQRQQNQKETYWNYVFH